MAREHNRLNIYCFLKCIKNLKDKDYMQEKVYSDIAKDVNSKEKRFTDLAKDIFLRIFYRFKKGAFSFNSEKYPYFYHPYNKTWRNERAVEIPLVCKLLNEHQGKNILEIGNVLSHYQKVNHDVVDKYETGPLVINQDIIDFHPQKKYDLIISISTIEHIGWDENPRDKTKTLKAIDHMVDLLSPEGFLYVTLPLAYNPDLEKLIEEGKIRFTEAHYMKRIPPRDRKYLKFIFESPSFHNEWEEAEQAELSQIKYGSPYPHANALLIGKISRKSE
jgi:SAM-dependent methyltransferase